MRRHRHLPEPRTRVALDGITATERARLTPAIFCNHANEVPMRCPCADDCYCRANTCSAVDVSRALRQAKHARVEGRKPEYPVDRAVDEARWRAVWSDAKGRR